MRIIKQTDSEIVFDSTGDSRIGGGVLLVVGVIFAVSAGVPGISSGALFPAIIGLIALIGALFGLRLLLTKTQIRVDGNTQRIVVRQTRPFGVHTQTIRPEDIASLQIASNTRAYDAGPGPANWVLSVMPKENRFWVLYLNDETSAGDLEKLRELAGTIGRFLGLPVADPYREGAQPG